MYYILNIVEGCYWIQGDFKDNPNANLPQPYIKEQAEYFTKNHPELAMVPEEEA